MKGPSKALSHNECAVCGDRKRPGETWFVITENSWEDRLKVWRWNRNLASATSAHSVCGQRHVRELVVHWMATGCLHYPFAATSLASQAPEVPQAAFRSGNEIEPFETELGELAVDREGIERLLRSNPLSLNTILDELMIALENDPMETAEKEHEEDGALVSRTM